MRRAKTTDRRSLLRGFAAALAATACRSADGPRPENDFWRAVRDGDVDAVRAAVTAERRRLQAIDGEGRSAFAVAWLNGHGPVAEVLRELGYEPDFVERCLAGELEEVAAEATRSELDVSHPIGGNGLWAAARTGRPDLWRLTGLGLRPDDAGRVGGAVHAALEHRDPLVAYQTALDLLGNGASARTAPSLMELALERGDARLVRLLARKGAPVNAAARALAPSVALDHRTSRFAYDASGAPWEGPDLLDVDSDVLQRVVGMSHFNFDGLRELVGDEVRLSCARSYQDELAVEACAHTGRRDIVQFHLDRGAPLSLPTSFVAGDLARARALLAEDPLRIHERGAHDFAVMWYPVIGRVGIEGLELLLDAGAPVDQESYGTTALHWAAQFDDVDSARLLLDRGADVNAVGYKFGRRVETPLDLAQRRGGERAAALLVERGGRSAAELQAQGA